MTGGSAGRGRLMGGWLAGARRRREERQALRTLLGLDDHLLRDINVRREDLLPPSERR